MPCPMVRGAKTRPTMTHPAPGQTPLFCYGDSPPNRARIPRHSRNSSKTDLPAKSELELCLQFGFVARVTRLRSSASYLLLPAASIRAVQPVSARRRDRPTGMRQLTALPRPRLSRLTHFGKPEPRPRLANAARSRPRPGRETPHVARRGRRSGGLAGDDPSHRRIMAQPLGVVNVLVGFVTLPCRGHEV